MGSAMGANNVVALQPYVVTVDVSLELQLITMEVTLCFGPFNSIEGAEEWCRTLEREHKVIEGHEGGEDVEAIAGTGLSTKPFLRAYVHGADIIQAGAEMRAKGALIPQNDPRVDAHQIHVYALHAFQEAVSAAFAFLDDANEPA